MFGAQRVTVCLAILLNVYELFLRVTIFKFFAPFVNQLECIIAESVPLMSILLLIILVQTILFWVLDQNSISRNYEGVSGFFICIVDSYRLALGDF